MERILALGLFIFLLTLQSCSHHKSGRFVEKNGKWVFVPASTGFSSRTASGRMDTTPYSYTNDGEFAWPVPSSKKISSHFGKRRGRHHDGIDIPAVSGTHIIASASGKVSFVGKMRGYGKTVVIKHPNGHHTVYAHARKYFVVKGQSVSQGEVIAQVGNTGRSSGPHLHFEIRKNNKVRNPAGYLNKKN